MCGCGFFVITKSNINPFIHQVLNTPMTPIKYKYKINNITIIIYITNDRKLQFLCK